MANYSNTLDAAFHALADPTRRAVVARLIEGETTVKALAEPFPMGLPTFLKHLKVLEDSGLIMTQKRGRTRSCRVEPRRLAEVEDWLAQRRLLWERRLDAFTEYVEALAESEKEI